MQGRIRRRPVLHRTIEFVRSLIAARALKPGDRIPPVRSLAGEADVSFVTMCRALRELRSSGVLTLLNKRVYAVAGECTPASIAHHQPPIARQPTIAPWRKVEQAIIEDIRNEVFRSGAVLPSTKILEARYRISYRTLKKALTHLAGLKSLERTVNGKFAVPKMQGSGWHQRIVCITPSNDMRTMAFGHHDEALLRALEFHCGQAGIKIDTLLLYYDPEYRRDRYRIRSTGAAMDCRKLSTIGADPVLGFVFFIPWELNMAYRRAISSLLQNRKPMVIVDETAQFRLPEEALRSGRTRITTIGSSHESGRIVAQHLLTLGHRRVAFVSADHHFLWSKKRLEGLRAVFAEAGLPEGVVALTSEGRSPNVDPVSSELAASYGQWRERIPAASRQGFDPWLARDVCERAEWQRRLDALVVEAIANTHTTALVIVNDSTASAVMAHLRETGVRVPSDFSVVSFDDSVEALRCGVSSYNFNSPARAASIVGYMLGKKPFCEEAPEVEGFIVDRGTIGPPSQSRKSFGRRLHER